VFAERKNLLVAEAQFEPTNSGANGRSRTHKVVTAIHRLTHVAHRSLHPHLCLARALVVVWEMNKILPNECSIVTKG
jgi:hypothetical protein